MTSENKYYSHICDYPIFTQQCQNSQKKRKRESVVNLKLQIFSKKLTTYIE